jgi:small subunit ribosomal protein S4
LKLARYTGPVCRQCRREGEKLFLKGDRCMTDKCSIVRRSYAPGQHGQGRKKVSEYGLQLREKQKVRRIYGVLERQFASYFELADSKKGITGENLLQILESRLDNVVYRLGFGASRKEARQLVRHGHFQVNGKKVNIPSFQIRPGDKVQLKDGSLESARIKELLEEIQDKSVPEWLELDSNSWTGTVKALPLREQIDLPVQEHLIVELYSR